MILTTQIQAMLYAFLCGLVYGMLHNMKQYFSRFLECMWHRTLITFIFHLIFVLCAFYGLYHINGGVSNFYLMLFFLFGIYMYYMMYYELFIYGFQKIEKTGKPIYYRFYLLMCSLYSIMNKQRTKKRRFRKHEQHKRKKKEKFSS